MLDKKQPFNECLGTLVDGVKFIQEDNAYAPNGTFLGVMKDGKLVKTAEITPEPPALPENKPNGDGDSQGADSTDGEGTTDATSSAPEADQTPSPETGDSDSQPADPSPDASATTQEDKGVDLEAMDRPELLAYAMETFEVKLKGNASAVTLREEIKALQLAVAATE